MSRNVVLIPTRVCVVDPTCSLFMDLTVPGCTNISQFFFSSIKNIGLMSGDRFLKI